MEVIPATGANALSVAEYVIATAMLLLRGAYQSHGRGRRRAVAAHGAVQRPRDGGKTLGLIGFGSIGQLTAKLARGARHGGRSPSTR